MEEQQGAELVVAARLAVAAAALAAAAFLPGQAAVAAGVVIGADVVLAVLAWRRPSNGWRRRALLVGDPLTAGLAGGLVALVAAPALMPLGAVAGALAAGALAYDGGWPAGARAGAASTLAAGAVALGRTRDSDAVAVLAVAVLAGWLVWAGAAAAALVASTEEDRAALVKARTEMVTTVSHELRTPLTVIQGAMATLSKRWDQLTEPERLDLVDVLIDNVASLDSSILHFVDAARLERGTFVVEPEWVDLEEALSRVRTKLATVLSGHELKSELSVSEAWADRQALGRMFEHLIVNAVRFSAVGLPIRVRASLQGDELVISVSDQGQGIAPHLLHRVWDPLERGDVSETGVSRGAGLGLPIVRELARLHGGDADLRSVKGRGTTVTVRLPQPALTDLSQITELPRLPRRGRRHA